MDWYSYGQEATRRVAEVAREAERRGALGLSRRGRAGPASASTPEAKKPTKAAVVAAASWALLEELGLE